MKYRSILLAILILHGSKNLFSQRSSRKTPGGVSHPKTEIKAGKLLYEKYSCMSCHGENGKLAGDLTNAWKKYSDQQMASYIRDPRAFSNLKMPVYNEIIPEADYHALIVYIRHLGQEAHKKEKKEKK